MRKSPDLFHNNIDVLTDDLTVADLVSEVVN